VSRLTTLQIVRRVLAADFACDEECFERDGVHFFERQEREGRRRFPRQADRPAFSMATMGKGVVITASADRLDWAQENLSGLERDDLFSARVLVQLERLVAPDDQFIYGPNLLHVCFADSRREVESPNEVELTIVDTDEIPSLHVNDGFRNALGSRVNPLRPTVLATVARQGTAIVGIAGASADSDDLWQIGVDVLAPYRNRNIGKALVHRLTSAICDRGKVPYYATLASNLPSRNVANRVGYAPCWIEVGSFERSRLKSP
jgi:GNAT superfamily N-acetyltransferase